MSRCLERSGSLAFDVAPAVHQRSQMLRYVVGTLSMLGWASAVYQSRVRFRLLMGMLLTRCLRFGVDDEGQRCTGMVSRDPVPLPGESGGGLGGGQVGTWCAQSSFVEIGLTLSTRNHFTIPM